MVQPIDYRINVQNPFESALSGFKIGAGVADIQAQREAAALKLQQQQAALKEAEKNKAYLTLGAQTLAAIDAGNTDVALGIIQGRIDAEKNAGNQQEANALNTWAELIKFNPSAAGGVINRFITATPGGKELLDAAKIAGEEQRAAALQAPKMKAEEATARQKEAEAAVAEGTTESKIAKERSEAEKAAVAAKFAESNAVIDLEKKGWDIKKLQSDMQIAKQNAAIAAANLAIGREGNDLKRTELELKLKDLKDKRDQAVREKVAEANTSAMQADNLLNTIDGLMSKIVEKTDKSGKPTFTSTFRAATGPVDVLLPTIQPDVADVQEQFATLGSQITMSRIGEMKGALSDKDLETLRQSLQSLSLRQSPDQLYRNLKEVQRLTLKARKGAFEKYGVPETVPDTPNVKVEPGEIADILRQYKVR